MAPRTKAYIELLIVTAIWGVAGAIIKFTLQGFDSLTFLTYRFAVSTVVALIAFAVLGIHLPKDNEVRKKLLLYGFLTSTVSLGFLFFGLENTTVLDMSLITLANPLLVTIAGTYFLNEHVTKKEKLGISIALVGTLLTVVEPLIQNGHGSIKLSGNVLLVGYLLASAWSAVVAKEILRKEVSPFLMSNVSFIIGFLSFLPVLLFLRPKFDIWHLVYNISPAYHAGVFYMALVSGTLAYFLSNKAQKTIEVGKAAIFSYLYPIFSTPLAVFWLGEKVTSLFILGAIVVACGVAIAETKNFRGKLLAHKD